MKILRTIAVAFAQYSRIPMPRFGWEDEDMRYSLAVFPAVGAVIGLICYGLFVITDRAGMPRFAVAALFTTIPLIVTGGFHVDGFMDVCDALSSYRSREEKLAILKDPHIGAFAVIRLAVCGLIWLASVIVIVDAGCSDELIRTLGAGFVMSRALSAVSVLNFRSARQDGMLYCEATSAAPARNTNMVIVMIWLLLAVCLGFVFSGLRSLLMIAAALISFAWYRYISYREFGGITGDTAGYFVTVCETASAAALAVSVYFL